VRIKMAVDPHLESNPQLEPHERMFLGGDPAAPALAGIRKSEITDKLELYEKHFAEETRQLPEELAKMPSGIVLRLFGWLGFRHTENALALTQGALKIARMELKDLAIAHATALNNQNAEIIKGDFYKQYTELAGNLNDFHHFLIDNYRRETEDGIATHRTLLDIAKGIIIEQRKRLPG